ncbi:glycosyltransferase family 2 protein [Backusella circina FSU 941]|nr:glycosyltransferase family 2 protein [Backusella circina FSU 941]
MRLNSNTNHIHRSKSLTRPERQRPKQSMFQNNLLPVALVPSEDTAKDDKKEPNVLTSWWAWWAFLCTCCFPPFIIKKCFGKTNKSMQQAWREKVTLCYLVAFLCGFLAYIIYGLNIDLCPQNRETYPYSKMIDGVPTPIEYTDVFVFGRMVPFDTMKDYLSTKNMTLTSDFAGVEMGSIFDGDINGDCDSYKVGDHDPTLPYCAATSRNGKVSEAADGKCFPLAELNKNLDKNIYLSFTWDDIRHNNLADSDFSLLGDTVLNLTTYFRYNNKPLFGGSVDIAIRTTRGNDMTYALLYTTEGKDARKCLLARYGIGASSQEVGSCIADHIIMNVMLAVIIIIIVVRYAMACLFQWFIAARLTKPGGRSNWLAWRSKRGGNDDLVNHIPGPTHFQPISPNLTGNMDGSLGTTPRNSRTTLSSGQSRPQTDIVDTELYTVMLVTCYSEGEEGLRTTMDSLSNTTYSNKHKIFFVIADGLITGAGETKSTPDIVVGMMDLEPEMTNPKPCSYLAVANGEKQLNMAKVYAGHYNGTPCITIIKCGTQEEQAGAKAGNRGKRDSQVIVMSFFQRVLFNDRLSELDYEIFWNMTRLMKGVTPDNFEVVLMVDADTMVLPDALTYMVATMANDITIMGLCGETRIANKRTSWVTAIQVFEYFISHHYAKAFESLFGMVTCLPGCFSMYRIKSPKNGSWVPILANPDIILEYNQNIVTTLHEKNLLLLGEDRFLSTLMLRTFPKRQMMFVPQARCRTVVPDEFSVLLSQRRRWINSTVHNLFELVLVSDLCGIACLSMQFSVFVDLIGTLVLPAAIVMSIYLLISVAISPSPQWQSLGLLLAILLLPAILIAITTFKLIYILWMIIYICALPVWNLVLPLYSYWHFDDFSWGATRVVVGEQKGDSHDASEGTFDSSRLIMKKWEDWEAERTGRKRNFKRALKTPQTYDFKLNTKSYF